MRGLAERLSCGHAILKEDTMSGYREFTAYRERMNEKILAREREMLAEIEDDDTRVMLETGMVFLSTHPATEDRIASISQQIKRLPRQEYKNLDSVFEKLQTAVKQFVTETEEDVKDNEIND